MEYAHIYTKYRNYRNCGREPYSTLGNHISHCETWQRTKGTQHYKIVCKKPSRKPFYEEPYSVKPYSKQETMQRTIQNKTIGIPQETKLGAPYLE